MTVTTPPGRVSRDEEGMRLEFRRTYDDGIEEVWSALTDPDRLARWFGTVSGDPATGTVDLVFVEAEGAAPEKVPILHCVPPTRLVVDLPSPDGTWRMSVELKSDAGVTTLDLSQRLAEPYDASSIGPGWQYYLDRLDAVIAGTPVPDNFDDYFPSLSEAYALPG